MVTAEQLLIGIVLVQWAYIVWSTVKHHKLIDKLTNKIMSTDYVSYVSTQSQASASNKLTKAIKQQTKATQQGSDSIVRVNDPVLGGTY